jgi:hypothetical protein
LNGLSDWDLPLVDDHACARARGDLVERGRYAAARRITQTMNCDVVSLAIG